MRRASRDWFWFRPSLAEKVARFLIVNQPQSEVKKIRITFEAHATENHSTEPTWELIFQLFL